MAEFTAHDVAELRKQTGAGMMDCKRALAESGGDIDAAKDWLRTQGLAGSSKRAARAADQGAVAVVVDDRVAAIVELSCETDFVAKSADFRAVVTALARQAALLGADGFAEQAFESGTVAEAVTRLGSTVGEKVELGRVVRYETDDGVLDGYQHVQTERGVIGVLVEVGGVDRQSSRARDVAHDVALHIASAAPRYLTRDDVPPEIVAKERAVLEELTRNEGKPEPAVPKIVEGRMNGFYKDTVLVEQPFVRDQKTTVGALVESLGSGAELRRFDRVKVGEGI